MLLYHETRRKRGWPDRGPDCPDDLGPSFREMLVTDGDSLGTRLRVVIAICPHECRVPRPLPGLFSVDLETGRRYPVFIVLVRY
jgi:hypothetical protein